MSPRTTIYDIAKELNITAATVSRALNNDKKISAATRELVKKTAIEMHYEPNQLALALKKGKSNNVGVIVPHIDRNFFSSVIRGIEEVLYQDGYNVIICQANDEEVIEIKKMDALLNAQVDGIFMSISTITDKKKSAVERILKKNVPLIFFDRKLDVDGVSAVVINDFEGGYAATSHLIDQGCKRIAHLGGDLSIEIYQERYKGYRQALEEHGMEFRSEYLIQSKSKVDAGADATKILLALPEPPDAIFSSSDFVALGAIQTLKSRGIKIPDDFCVVGFSNEPFTNFMEQTITTVDQFPVEMGKIAAGVFLEHVNKTNGTKIEKKVVMKPELLIRSSSLRK